MNNRLRRMMENARARLLKRADMKGDASEWVLLNDYDCRRMRGDRSVEEKIVAEAGRDALENLYRMAKCERLSGHEFRIGRLLGGNNLDAIVTMQRIDRLLGR